MSQSQVALPVLIGSVTDFGFLGPHSDSFKSGLGYSRAQHSITSGRHLASGWRTRKIAATRIDSSP